MSQPAFDFGDEELDDVTNPTYTVGELAGAINDSLRRTFHDGVWVRGEITGWSDRGTHAYFSLADDGGDERAVVNVQFFANVRARLRPLLRKHRLQLADGMKVRIFGYLDYYAPTGRIGLKMSGIDPRYTLGEIAQGRDEVLRRLVAEGLLDTNGRLLLPSLPLRVGVVTSVGSAAWHDFRDELERSRLGFALTVCDVRVQGETAEQMITTAITALGRHDRLDAIAVIRGGGARNELAVFDAEPIARAIANAPLPVITGLGHETDRSVADEVAHTVAKTPTACAGELVARVRGACDGAEHTWQAIVRRADATLATCGSDLADRAHRIARRTHAAVERADERLGQRVQRLVSAAPGCLRRADEHLERSAARVRDLPGRRLAEAGGRLDLAAARLSAVDPAVQLARGWSITRRADGSVVRNVTDVSAGTRLITTVLDGSVTSDVRATTPTDDGDEPDARP